MGKTKKEMINALDLLDKITALTFTRHANLSEQDYLKEIKAKEGLGEEQATINARFVMIQEITKELFKSIEKVELINGTLQLALGMVDEKKENE